MSASAPFGHGGDADRFPRMHDNRAYQAFVARLLVFENKKKLVTVHRAFRSLNPMKMNVDIGVPYHRAAIKFYREKGM
jgi:TRAP-type uncharacterized transport system substrate-binding protein